MPGHAKRWFVTPERGFLGSLPLWITLPTTRTLVRVFYYATGLALPAWAFWRFGKELLARATTIGYDEQFFVWGGWSILKGLAPYRDFIEYKPPLTFLSHALALELFGYEHERFRYYFFALAMTSVLAFLLSLLMRGADILMCSALGLVIAHMFTYPPWHDAFLADTESIGLSYYLLAVAALVAPVRRRKVAEILGGALLACAALSKEPFAPCVIATWISSYFFVHGTYARDSARSYVKHTTIGVAIAVLALCVYMVPTGAMTAYLVTLRGYLQMFRDPKNGYCVLLGNFHPTGKFLDDLPRQWDVIRIQFLNVATLGFLTPFFVASSVFTIRRSWALFATSLLTFAASLYGVTASHCYFPHYYVLAQSGLFFFLGAGVDAMGRVLAVSGRSVRVWSGGVVLLAIVLHVWPRIEALPPLDPTPSAAWAPLEPEPGLYQFIREHSDPSDKIFTTGPPGLYVYADRVAAVRESSIIDELVPTMPGNTDAEKLRPLFEELVRNRPKIVFLDPEHGNRKGRHMAAAITPFLTQYNYLKVSETRYLRP